MQKNLRIGTTFLWVEYKDLRCDISIRLPTPGSFDMPDFRFPPSPFHMSSFNTGKYPGIEHPEHNPSLNPFLDILF